jgi:ribosomal-protein-alanine N-acetyltransferase
MVARPPALLRIEAMRLADLPEVHAIEQASFTTPWPPQAYRSELETNRLAAYLVARIDGRVVGYAGVWMMVDEAHITTFAVHPAWRRQRIGERLILAVLDLAVDRGARDATLEVRLGNLGARRLYEKYGFGPVGLRPNYYSDDHEDALIMTTPPLDDPAMRDRLARLRAALDAEPPPRRRPASGGEPLTPPTPPTEPRR